MNQDLTAILVWWFLLFVIGWISFPTSFVVFRNLIDKGYGFTKILGTLLITYIIFLGGTSHAVSLSRTNMIGVTALFGILNAILYIHFWDDIKRGVKKSLGIIFFQEVLFSAGFLLWVFVRSHQPDINGLEKFMDFGFINSILRSDYLPPTDMWFSGKPINYYWFGHLWVAVLTKLSNIPSFVTYNLTLATILGMALNSAFSISSTLLKATTTKLKASKVVVAGILSAILLVFAGNFHTPFYVLKDGPDKYWYPDATRFIGYNPDINDKTIHEFPLYSFVVSDLHAHLLNLPFVLLYVALLWRLISKEKDSFQQTLSHAFPLGFLLGVMFMTNTWDFANYLLITGVTLGFYYLWKDGLRIGSFLKIAALISAIILIGLVIALPFILNFESIAEGARFVNSRTPLWQLGVLWGFPAIFTIAFFTLTSIKWKMVKTSDVFIAGLLFASWLLIFIPEMIYVKDIYIASHHRANTMFKLTYQAFVMFYLCIGYISIRSMHLVENLGKRLLLSGLFVILFASVLWYPRFAINSYYSGLKNYSGLSGETWLAKRYPHEYNSVLWLRSNVLDQPIILEAPGDSYTDYNVISAYTGLPTVSGWFVHEWLWRGKPEIPQARVTDIVTMYNTANSDEALGLLKKYNISYVIVGTLERQKYPELQEGKFTEIGNLVYSSGNTNIYRVN